MEHRIQLSTALLIAVKAEKKQTLNTKLRPAGIKMNPGRLAVTDKSMHSVDVEGRIIMTSLQEDFAA